MLPEYFYYSEPSTLLKDLLNGVATSTIISVSVEQLLADPTSRPWKCQIPL